MGMKPNNPADSKTPIGKNRKGFFISFKALTLHSTYKIYNMCQMKKKVLVIDDDLPILEALTDVLETFNYEVATVSDGHILPAIEKEQPDIILLDMLMSGIDGRNVTKKLKNNTVTKLIPIIMLSAHPNAEQSTLEAGANDFLAKPFDIHDLLEKIEKHLPK